MRKNGVPPAADGGPRSGRVAAVSHAMQLLELLVRGGELSVSRAAEHLGVAPSTASRLLATMRDHGFVERTAGRRYRLGQVLARAPVDPATQLAAQLGPTLRELFETVDETVHLMTLVGGDIVFIDGIESNQELRVGLRIGARMPAYCNSGGKAILAELGPSILGKVYPHGLPSWPTQRLRTFEELERELAEVRAVGVAYNRGESEAGVRALGIALTGSGGYPAAALAVSVPMDRFVAPDAGRFVRALHDARARGERVLAGEAPTS